jgi:hypothetical protein
MGDSALVSCSELNIFNITPLINLCELDYDASPVYKHFWTFGKN